MNSLSQKIARQSDIILVMTLIARIILYVLLGFALFMLISSFMPSDQPIFKFGKTEVYASIPLRILLGADIQDEPARLADLRTDLVVQLITYTLAQILLGIVTKLFKHIRESESPFTREAVKAMKTLAILLGIVVGFSNGIFGVVIAFVIFAFAMIFQYGMELQNQVDETL